MALYLIGLGLGSIQDITGRGLHLAQKADEVLLEHYTSSFRSSVEEIEHALHRKVKLAFREDLEQGSGALLEKAKQKDVALLVVGDVFSATTHMALFLEARRLGIAVQVVFNASVMTAIGITGLELYKFGKTTSIPFPSKGPASTPYKVIAANKSAGLHTLCLLDLELDDAAHPNYMTIAEAIALLQAEERRQALGALLPTTIALGCARLGQDDFLVKAGTLEELSGADFGMPLHCLIIPGALHFVEEEALSSWKV